MKPRTSPAPASKPSDGFTFIEVLVAIIVAGLLIGVSSVSLITSLRAEQNAAWLRDTIPLLRQTTARTWLGTIIDEPVTDPEWEIVGAADEKSDGGPWQLWILSPKQRPSLRVTLASRM